MFFVKRRPQPVYVSAVVVAAGSASRMEGVDKQQYPLGDIPVVVRSLTAFCDTEEISEVVLVCREAEIAAYYALAQDYGLLKVRQIVAGGEYRQASVFNGISACARDAAYYAIHDGARPLVTPQIVADCLENAVRYGAAAAGVPVKDTIKVVSADGLIQSTPDRSAMFAIQTPQIFEAGLYRRAMEEAIRIGRRYTDDCQLIENIGHRVFLSRGDYANIKITTPEDLAVAGALIDYYEGGDGQ